MSKYESPFVALLPADDLTRCRGKEGREGCILCLSRITPIPRGHAVKWAAFDSRIGKDGKCSQQQS